MILMMWILYTVYGVLVFSLVFLWAVRARQFGDQDRARYLPLGDEVPAEGPEDTPPEAADQAGIGVSLLAPILIFAAALGLMLLTMLLSYLQR